jgi:hypothetical protein
LRRREIRDSIAAAVLPPRSAGTGGALERSGGRRWEVAGDPPGSLHDIGHEHAAAVLEALHEIGVHPFLVKADDSTLGFGVRIGERPDAARALDALSREPGWFVDWRRGGRTATVALGSERLPRSLSRAEWWRIYRLYRSGRHALAGRDQAVELSFWARGESGQLERIGVRGHHRFPVDAPLTTETIDGRTYPGVASFPVERALTRFGDPVDVVYTWVDGDDPTWRAEFDRWVSIERPDQHGDHAVHASRYRSRDELRYSLRSLWLNAGWVRNVFLVTAGQIPDWLVADDRLRVVSHREIFPGDWLPTFNSHAIEARLHHIDGLAEHFLYMNDDVFFGRALTPRTFFTPNGLSRFFESEARVPLAESETPVLAVNTAARHGQRIILETFGRVVERKLHHGPHALRRSVLFEIEERFGDVIERTAQARFRHPDDLSVPSAFAHHYGFCTGRAVLGEMNVGYVGLESRRLRIFLERLLLGRDLDVFCLNETEAAFGDSTAVDEMLTAFLKAYFSVPSPWEKPNGSTEA